jgi:putative ABC transport system ATP-binding protein
MLLKAIDISMVYETGKVSVGALKGVSLEVKKGEYIAIMGASGSGKSTLMHILGCLDTPTAGTYYFKDQEVSKLSDLELARIRNREIGFIFQTFNLLPRLTAFQNVELPLIYASTSRPERRKRVETELRRVGIWERQDHRPNELSGGESQRVAIARALINQPALLLADEPTGNLDSANGAEIMSIFDALSKEGNTIILVTHDTQIARHAQRVIKIKDGKIV